MKKDTTPLKKNRGELTMDKTEGDRSFYEILQSPGTASHRVRSLLIRQWFSAHRTGLYTFHHLLQNLYVLRGTHHVETELYSEARVLNTADRG
jgi:hypothetical protein